MRFFVIPLLIALLALGVALLWSGAEGLFICALLIIMEVSFSFDNAVVNAGVLKAMDSSWQQRFLTWGMLIAVFGMYVLFPLVIVAMASGTGLPEVVQLALHEPKTYQQYLMASHSRIAAFGGMFLLMVFLTFLLDARKTCHWLGKLEATLASFGKLESIEVIIALLVLLGVQYVLPQAARLPVMLAGVFGVVLYVAINGITCLFSAKEGQKTAYSGLSGFFYLNLLDASFSLDAVVGAFALSQDIVIIVLGLSTGALFVRSLTVYLVKRGTLDQYVFLEHGAHYGIGALAVIMLVSLFITVPETVTGLAGLTLIVLSLASSLRYNRLKKG